MHAPLEAAQLIKPRFDHVYFLAFAAAAPASLIAR